MYTIKSAQRVDHLEDAEIDSTSRSPQGCQEMTVEESLSDDKDEDGVLHCVSDSESESENDSD
jgi:hypothetical protein